jgi:pentatricopeptide repeat protein
MYLNAIISLIKANSMDDAKKMLKQAKKQSHFSSV